MSLTRTDARGVAVATVVTCLALAVACSDEVTPPTDGLVDGGATSSSSSSGSSGADAEPGPVAEVDSGVVDGVLPDGGLSFEDLGLRHKSGTRLTARFAKDANGVRAFLGFRDTLRAEDCVLQGGAGGIVQCLPERKSSLDVSFLYSNAACTSRVAVDTRGGCAPKYAFLVAGCNSNWEVFALGAKLATTSVYRNGTGPCELDTFTSANGSALYPFGAKIAPTEFVTFTRSVGPAANGIAVAELKGTDGSSSFESLVDVASGSRCVVRATSDGVLRCVPVGAAYSVGSYFADAACTTPALRTSPSACEPVKFTLQTSDVPSSCTQQVRARTVGPTLTSVYLKGGNTCTTVSVSQCQGCTSPGAEVAPSTFVPLPKVTGVPSRIRPTTHLASPGLATRTGLHDTLKNDACEVGYAADGKLRCIPGASADRFVDAACTVPAVSSNSARLCSVKYVSTIDEATCPARRRVFVAGAETTAITYFKVGTKCTADGFATRFVPGTTEVPAAELAEFTFE